MVCGIGFTATYIIGSVYAGMPNWFFGIGPQGIGAVGMLLNFVVTLALTPLTKAPSDEVRAMIDTIHEPGVGGRTMACGSGAGPEEIFESGEAGARSRSRPTLPWYSH